jgi:hypothetical protein
MGARTRGFANNVLTSGKIDATDGLTGNLASANFANATVTNVEELPPAVGSAISSVAGNPAAPVAEGKIWYNTSTDTFNVAPVLEAWSSGANLSTARRASASGGTQTANFIAGGQTPSFTNITEEYNGSGWSNGGNTNTTSYVRYGGGTLTAGIAFGGSTDPTGQEGFTPGNTEEYDGSAWTTGGDLNQKRWSSSSGAGTQTATLCSSGYNDGNISNSEEYNGTSWTAGNTVNTTRRDYGQCGTQTASVLFGGITTGRVATTEEYDGTIYSSATSLPGARSALGASGIQTAALGFGGYVDPGYSNNTFEYDGTTWSSVPNLATALDGQGGSRGGTSSAALSAGGTTSTGLTSVTEEYNKSVNVITAGAWASGGNLPTGRSALSGAGTQTAGLGFGGYTGPPGDIPSTVVTLKYDGSSWTTSGNLNTARQAGGPSSAGSQTAALYFGGATAFSTPTDATKIDATESFNGSTWSTLPAVMNTKRLGMGGSGTQTSALAFGGGVSPNANPTTATESYNGSTWTNVSAMNTTRRYISGCGTQTATLAASGFPGGGVEEWDGSTWTTSNNSNKNRQNKGALCGVQTNALLGGGGSGGTPFAGATEEYNGTSWVTAPSMAVGRYNIGAASASSANASMGFGGTGYPTSTEEFTGETSALNVESLTTS